MAANGTPPIIKERHMRFAVEYLANGYKAIDAYMAVYPECQRRTCESNAYKLLRRPEIKEFIDKRRQEILESKMIDATRWIDEVASIAFAAKGDEIYTSADKLKALQMIQKYLGLDVQKQEVKQEIIEVCLIDDED